MLEDYTSNWCNESKGNELHCLYLYFLTKVGDERLQYKNMSQT